MKAILSGKVAIVTGASRGTCRAIALKLAWDGAAVMLAARDAEQLRQAATEIESSSGKAAWASTDLREPEAPGALAARTIETFGGIDIVVNSAGATKRGDFMALSEEDWMDGFALKFFGAVRLTRAAWPSLKQRKGSVVNIAGIGGWTPGTEFTIGGSVNAAMLSFTKAMADIGVADGVQVNAINPGAVRTARRTARLQRISEQKSISLAEAEARMVAESGTTRIGEPEDVANLAAFIVSPRNRFLQGALIDLDGGATKSL